MPMCWGVSFWICGAKGEDDERNRLSAVQRPRHLVFSVRTVVSVGCPVLTR